MNQKNKGEKNGRGIFVRALSGDVSVLAHPLVATARDIANRTPLHRFALAGCPECLAHPDCATVKDKWGWTPLHYLAARHCEAALAHPEVASVQNDIGETPLHWLAKHGNKKAKVMLADMEIAP